MKGGGLERTTTDSMSHLPGVVVLLKSVLVMVFGGWRLKGKVPMSGFCVFVRETAFIVCVLLLGCALSKLW